MARNILLPPAVLAALLFVFGPGPAAAQEEAGDADAPTFAEKFWNYLEEVDYRENWSPWPGTEGEFMEGQSPHGALLKIYVNKPVVENPNRPPPKSIIVKENYNKDKELLAITPMYRIPKEYDPEHNDWFWAKYLPDGKVAEMDGKKVSGRVQSCIQCHASAQGEDYIFSNDEAGE